MSQTRPRTVRSQNTVWLDLHGIDSVHRRVSMPFMNRVGALKLEHVNVVGTELASAMLIS